MSETCTSFVAVGANLGDAKASVLSAINAIGELPQTRLLRASSLYRTAPFGAAGPDYINAVVELATQLTPEALLAHLQSLENAALRQRPYQNAPRTLDLDILLFADSVIQTPSLQVPHPRMWQRAFVLVPLSEIAPKRVTTKQLEAVKDQTIERIEAPRSVLNS